MLWMNLFVQTLLGGLVVLHPFLERKLQTSTQREEDDDDENPMNENRGGSIRSFFTLHNAAAACTQRVADAVDIGCYGSHIFP